jgi:hypothetical protein
MMPSVSLDLVEPLREALGEEIAALNLRRSQLKLLREAILERDDEAVERLLGQLEQAQSIQSLLEVRLRALREALADELDLPLGRTTLSALIQRLPLAAARELDLCRREVIHLVRGLQRQHLELAILLRECARINRLMVEQLLGPGRRVTTYAAGGRREWQDGAGLMDTES